MDHKYNLRSRKILLTNHISSKMYAISARILIIFIHRKVREKLCTLFLKAAVKKYGTVVLVMNGEDWRRGMCTV